MNIDIAAVFAELNSIALALLPLFSLFGIVAGLVLLAKAAKSLVWGGHNGQQDPEIGAILGRMFMAACLIQFGVSIDWTRDLLAGVGSGTRTAMSVIVTSSSPSWQAILDGSLLWLAVIGVAGMFRGFLLMDKAVSGDNQQNGGDFFWRGLWHIIGGAICINIGT